MKILFLNDNLIGGGVEKLLSELLPLINQEEKCDLLILTWENEKYRDTLESLGVKVDSIPPEINGKIGTIRYIHNYIISGNYDLIHVNEFPMLYYASIAVKTMKIKPVMVFTEHATSNRRRKIKPIRFLERWIYQEYDRIICISDAVKKELKSWLSPFSEEKFVVIYNGLLLDSYKRARPAIRTELFPGIEAENILLCMVGRLSYEKNHHYMIEVMAQLPDKFKLIICGDGPLYDELFDEVKKKNLNEQIRFLGFREDVASVMKASDIVVIPSLTEGFGLVSIEAMACEIPVVCTDVPGLSEIVENAGIKVPLDNVDSFVVAIENMMEPKIRKLYVDRGVSQSEKYSILKMKNSYVHLYHKVSERK